MATDSAAVSLPAFTLRSLPEAIEAGGVIVLNFWAPWCGTCHRFSPVFARVAAAHVGDSIVFATVNTDDEQHLAGLFAVQALPTVVIIRDGKVVFAEPGPFTGRDLERILTRVS